MATHRQLRTRFCGVCCRCGHAGHSRALPRDGATQGMVSPTPLSLHNRSRQPNRFRATDLANRLSAAAWMVSSQGLGPAQHHSYSVLGQKFLTHPTSSPLLTFRWQQAPPFADRAASGSRTDGFIVMARERRHVLCDTVSRPHFAEQRYSAWGGLWRSAAETETST